MEIRSMFYELRIVSHPPIAFQPAATARPRSSSTAKRKLKAPETKTAQTARGVISRKKRPPTRQRTARTNRSDTLFRDPAPSALDKKKLQRSSSTLYIRESTKSKKTSVSALSMKKKVAPKLTLRLDLDRVVNGDDAECVVLSGPFSKKQNPPQRVPVNPKVFRTADEYRHQHLLQQTVLPPLMPSASMASFHENKPPQTMRSAAAAALDTPKPLGYGLRTSKFRRKSKKSTASNAIPVRSFDPKIDRALKSRDSASAHSQHQNDGEGANGRDELGVRDIDRYHHRGLNDKENVVPVLPAQRLRPFEFHGQSAPQNATRRMHRKDSDANLTLEQKLKKIIARWESHEKIKQRKSDRAKRLRPFR